MGLHLKLSAIALFFFFATTKAFESWVVANDINPSKGDGDGDDQAQKFLCGDNFEKCFGTKLNSVVFLSDSKLYRVEVYDYKLPTTLDEIMEEEKSLKNEIDLLENKLSQQGRDIYTNLEKANAVHIESDFDISQRAKDEREHLESKLTGNMNQMKSTLLNILKTKLNRMDTRIRKPLENDTNADLPNSCAEAFTMYETTESGVFELYLRDYELAPFKAYCLADPDGGPAWTVVQRRMDGTEDFYRDWDDYVTGFGDPEGEYFIGLDRLHALTNDQPNELWIQLEDFHDEERFAKYTDFAIGDLDENYALKKLNGYRGDAGDSLVEQKGCEFSTHDRDNDNDPTKSCAVTYNGAWWYNHCHDSNLNGRYIRGGYYDYYEEAQGIDWYSWHGHQYSLRYVHMAIRPKYYF
ncbi:ficolin-2-like [Bactrocera neohumeralis]|uniref:ficolin-2-like n=1 Tax=Bactrocera neohumeralis TaxID=98809 RepID=UPI0021664A10|nr:ficolin-2-like [Bactrocera neohumeralis]